MRRLRTRFVIAGFLVAMATIASGIWSAYTFTQLSRVIGDTLSQSQQRIDLTDTLASALEREDDALLLAINGDVGRAIEEVQAQRVRFDDAYASLWNILHDEEQAMALSLRRHADAYRAEDDALLAAARQSDASARYHEAMTPVLRKLEAVADCAHLRESTFRSMQRADIQSRDRARRAIGVVAGVSLGALVVSTLAALHLARTVVRPLRHLTESVDALRLGEFDRRVEVASPDELGRLAAGFNRMAKALAEFRRLNLGEVVRAKETLEATLAALPDAVIVIDPEGRIASVNALARAVLQAAGGEHATRLDELPLTVDHLQAVHDALRGLRPPGIGPEPGRTLSVTLDGRHCWFAPAVVPIPAFSQDRFGAIVVLTDVTDFVRLDELRAELIALVSHELKTPLTTLRMNLLLLGERANELTLGQREILSAAILGCEELAATIDELLDLSRIEAGQLRLALSHVDLFALLDHALYAFRDRFEQAGVALDVRQERLSAVVLGDASRLALVLSNLLSNALRYTPRGGKVVVSVSSRQSAGLARPERLQIAVTDTGPGIPEDLRHRVFEKFFRIEEPRVPGHTAIQGAGFGLYLCRQIVEAHGDTIWCEAGDHGRGTRIVVELNVAPPGR
jgi:two-component system, NtrC family, sensor histidine kinase KinB